MNPSLQQVDEAFDAFFDNVCAADCPPPTTVGIFDAIPLPRDPYGCANPINQSDEE